MINDNGSLRVRRGEKMRMLGLVCLAGGAGLTAGFWLAYAGVRWMPMVLNVLLAFWIASMLAFFLADRDKPADSACPRRSPRKRTVAFVLAIVLGVGLRCFVGCVHRPSSLIRTAGVEFETVFRLDAQRFREYDRTLQRLIQAFESRPAMFDESAPRALSADEEQFLRSGWTALYETAFALDNLRLYYEDWYRFDPSRIERSYHVRSYLLTFAAELSLYETASRMVRLLEANPNAAKFLNTPDPAGRLGADSVRWFRREFQGVRDAARVVAGRQYLRWLDLALAGRDVADDTGCSWMWDRVESQLNSIDRLGVVELSTATVGSDMQAFKKGVHRVWLPMQAGVARWMGNTRVRRPGTYLIDKAARDAMLPHLLPGDVMLSRKNWYLSNVALPGFWPHAILYIGSAAELEAYFDDADVRAYLQGLAGQPVSMGEYLAERYPGSWKTYTTPSGGEPVRVIEGVSPGIMLHTLAKASGDYMAALRPRLDKVAKAQAIIAAFGHVGKSYDYDLDFATDDVLVCTELVWRSYRPAEGKAGLNVSLCDIAGRQTLPANEFAKLFAAEHDSPDAQFDFVYFLDASEQTRSTVVGTEKDFLASCQRSKWSISQD